MSTVSSGLLMNPAKLAEKIKSGMLSPKNDAKTEGSDSATTDGNEAQNG
jgi:hypothetical protein